MEEIKKSSSKWIKTKGAKYSDFYWQDACLPVRQGYAIFSINPTQLNLVSAYIQTQKAHHSKKSFKDELISFLKKYDIELDERFVWE